MMFSGLSLHDGLRLLEMHTTGKLASEQIPSCTTLYKDTFYLLRFTEILLENIRRSHTTLGYILRSQYRDADKVYRSLLDEETASGDIKQIVKHMTQEYYHDVFRYLISPQLKKYGMYSPTISYMIFISLVNTMYMEYMSKSWYNVDKEHIRRVTRIDLEYIQELVQANRNVFSDELYDQMSQEMQEWQVLKQRHFRRKN